MLDPFELVASLEITGITRMLDTNLHPLTSYLVKFEQGPRTEIKFVIQV